MRALHRAKNGSLGDMERLPPTYDGQEIDKLPRFWPKRFFYGWVIVFISFWDSMLTAGIQSYGFSVFLPVLSNHFGWSRGAISAVQLIRMVTTMIAAVFLGRFADQRHGPRYMMIAGGTVAGLSLILLSRMQTLWQFYVLFGVVFGIAMTALGGMILGPTIVSKWFIRKRGRALAIATMGVSAGGVVAIPLTRFFIDAFGWRLAWTALGIVMLTTIIPLGAIFMRRQPEDVGLLPDNDSDDEISAPIRGRQDTSRASALTIRGSFTARQAFKSHSLWILVVVQTLGSLALSPVLMHQIAYMQDKGMNPLTAAFIGTLVAFFAMVGKVPWGILAEHLHVRFVIAIAFTIAGSSLWLLIQANDQFMMYIAYSIFFGLSMGSMPPLNNLMWVSYFGRDNLGRIRGYVTPLTRWTGGFSPLFAGFMWDKVGNYDLAFTVFSLSWITAGLVVLFAGNPKEPEAASE